MWKFGPRATYNACGGSWLTGQPTRGKRTAPPSYLAGHSRYVHSLQDLLVRIRRECAANFICYTLAVNSHRLL